MNGTLVDAITAAFEKHDPEEWGPGPLSDFIEEYMAAPVGEQRSLDQSHAWGTCSVCGAMTTDPEAMEPCDGGQPR
jgi:hypothetical protein